MLQTMTPPVDAMLWRLQLARALAWALLLGGWIGLAALAQALASSVGMAFVLLAAWLLAVGGFADLVARLALPRWALRLLLCGAALLAARALHLALHGGGIAALGAAVLAWALMVALASAAVRGCRLALHTRAGPPVASAAAGAALAWLCVGDIGDANALGPRLAALGLAAGALLALLLPRGEGVAAACRAGLFDCSLPRWQAEDWQLPARRPVLIASLAMLPMMCSLPWMVSLCRSAAVAPEVVLAVHLAAMFLPAWLAMQRPRALQAAPTLCMALLATGAVVLLVAPGASAWWVLALAHGSAWSLAWASQLQLRGAPRGTAQHTVLAGASWNAGFVLALGIGVSLGGLQTLAACHVALGAAAVLAWALRRIAHAPTHPAQT